VNVDLARLLDDPSSLVAFLAASGGEVVAVPPQFDLAQATLLTPESPLDVVAAESQGPAVAAFVRSLNDGYGSGIVKLAESDQRAELHVFDRRRELDCVVVVYVPTDAPLEALTSGALLPARRCTSRQDASGRILWVDEGYTQLLGYTLDEILEDRSSSSRIHPDDLDRALQSFAELLQRPGGQTRIRMRTRHRNGHWVWCEVTQTNLLNSDEPHIFVEALDLTAEMAVATELAEREALLVRLTEALPVGVLHLGPNQEIRMFNQRWSVLTGTDPTDGLDAAISVFDQESDVRAALDAASVGEDMDLLVEFVSPDGTSERRRGLLRLQALDNHAEELSPRGILMTLDDLTESFREQTELARTDHLTQCLNRMGFEERATAELERADDSVVLLYVDLDNFKAINDTQGHQRGDEVLKATVDTLRANVRPNDVIGRMGGDEFGVMLVSVADETVTGMCARITEALKQDLSVGVSIGSARSNPQDDLFTLMAKADQDMYRRKARRDVN